jgi:hypothetical protein
MDDLYQSDNGLRALAMRVAALEDNVAFLEEWCEEQQDVLDRTAGPVVYDYEIEAEPEPTPRAALRVVDLRDEVLAVLEAATDDAEALVDDPGFDEPSFKEHSLNDRGLDLVETEHERRVRVIRARLERIRVRLRAAQS